MWDLIIFFGIFFGVIWLIIKFIEWIEKKREAIRDKVTKEVLASVDIEREIEKYQNKLKHIDYIRKDPIQEYLHYYDVKRFGQFADFYSNLGHCPQCKEGNLLLRVGKYGKFIGCSKYPKCNYTKNIKVAKLQYREAVSQQIIKDIQKAYS